MCLFMCTLCSHIVWPIEIKFGMHPTNSLPLHVSSAILYVIKVQSMLIFNQHLHMYISYPPLVISTDVYVCVCVSLSDFTYVAMCTQ